MSPSVANFLFEAANFLLLAAGLAWLLFKPVRRVLDAEQQKYAAAQAEAQRVREEAEALAKQTRVERETAVRELDERRREILASARKEASELVEASKKAQAAERQRLDQELALRRDAESAELAEAVGRLAAESVWRLLRSLDGPALDAALIRAARTELDSVPSEARKAALVESARPLDPESKRLLGSVLGAGFSERVVEELGAGVRITTQTGQIDATAASIARRAARAITEAASSADRAPEGSHA